jgi:hypothetical protein
MFAPDLTWRKMNFPYFSALMGMICNADFLREEWVE